MHEELIDSLVHSKNEAADDLLLEGLRVGTEIEQSVILSAILSRKEIRSLSGVVEKYESLPERLRIYVLNHIKVLHHALRECGRSDRVELRLAAMKLIALSRQCKLAYVLSENLHDSDEILSKAAADAMVALARWVATSTRKLQRGLPGAILSSNADQSTASNSETPSAGLSKEGSGIVIAGPESAEDFNALYRDLIEQRPEIETVVARALDVHRGKYSVELLRAALLLCDWPQSKVMAILHTSRHGGQSPMVRRLQLAPDSEHIEAFLLGASHGQLRSHFGNVFSHVTEAPVLDAFLRKTHWLKDHQLALCMHQVARGPWWQESELLRDINRRDAEEACRIGEWLAVSGMHDVMQDERLIRLADHASQSVSGRLRLIRIALRRKRGSSVAFLKSRLADGDERLMRIAARDIVRRRPADYENMLLQLMTNAPPSVRRVVSRSIGHVGFENFWQRFDRLDRPTRKQAGRAMLKLLPDAAQRLTRRLNSGPIDQRLKALQIAQELGMSDALHESIAALASHPHPKVRSKAVSVLGETPSASIDFLMEKVLNDTDARVRANAIEVLETRRAPQFVPLLAERAKASQNRERANAIKALNSMKVGNIGPQLSAMLHDERPEHRISAMWVLKQMGWWRMLQDVGQIAKEDTNLRVRRYAIGVLKGVADMVRTKKKEAV